MNKISTVGAADVAALADLGSGTSAVNKANSLKKLEAKDKKEIDKAAGGFEALLLHDMLKSMWATVDSTGLLGEDSNQAQIYRDMLNQAIADSVAKGRGIGVKQFLARELDKESKPNAEPAGEPTAPAGKSERFQRIG